MVTHQIALGITIPVNPALPTIPATPFMEFGQSTDIRRSLPPGDLKTVTAAVLDPSSSTAATLAADANSRNAIFPSVMETARTTGYAPCGDEC
ncbi:unnamed protein product [Zymoseptoria tritici ST99CH_3D7]|uniref:Uncharacterized protein n=1 Tax=Zymoseptoria tritici (strain ST99CH_3D7) TaxID=1276538 RepID=A0A1X7RX66_ZYMT9|nr:unnamed protein product [Zymoseptoria tritici ST99CH_3D7]